jgi:predicted GNAT family N-acyltransferase
MIQGKLLSYGDDLKEVYEIRQEVFVDELGYPREYERDGLDSEAIHVLVYEQEKGANPSKEKVVATGRITLEGNSCSISKIAVLKEYRNKEYGDFAVRMLINKAFTAGIGEVRVEVTSKTAEFFRKIGFQYGEMAEDSGVGSKRIMMITANDVITCCRK